jgi:predicted methyltransferase
VRQHKRDVGGRSVPARRERPQGVRTPQDFSPNPEASSSRSSSRSVMFCNQTKGALLPTFRASGRSVTLMLTRMRIRRVALLFGLLAVPSAVFTKSPVASILPQAVQLRSTDIIHRPTSQPYTGDLSVFEDPKRDKKLQVDRVMDLLRIHTGSTVADIGAGSGWFSVRAARRVGSSGRVYAEDINPSYLHYIRDRAQKEKLPHIRAILGKSDDPLLPSNSVDAVLLMKTYHEVAQPIVLLRHVHTAMRPGARLGIIDRNGRGDDHGVNRDVVIGEAKRAGFVLAADYDFVKPDGADYFLIFRP